MLFYSFKVALHLPPPHLTSTEFTPFDHRIRSAISPTYEQLSDRSVLLTSRLVHQVLVLVLGTRLRGSHVWSWCVKTHSAAPSGSGSASCSCFNAPPLLELLPTSGLPKVLNPAAQRAAFTFTPALLHSYGALNDRNLIKKKLTFVCQFEIWQKWISSSLNINV